MPEIIRGPLPHPHSNKPLLRVCADRFTLAKRRWRACAEDGRDFGFDLAHPLHDGELFFQTDAHAYRIEQIPEPVLEISLANFPSPAGLALLGWNIGNLHFPIEIDAECLRVADDPALRNLFERERIPVTQAVRVFHPLTSSAPHGHH